MRTIHLTMVLLILSLIVPTAQAKNSKKLSYLGSTNVEQYFDSSEFKYSFMYVSESVFRTAESTAIKGWPKEVYANTYKGGKVNLDERTLLKRDKNQYHFGQWSSMKTIPLSGSYALVIYDKKLSTEGLYHSDIYSLKNGVFRRVLLSTNEFYQLLQKSPLNWKFAQKTSRNKKYNYWVLDGTIEPLVDTINSYFDKKYMTYSAYEYKVMQKSESDAYKTYLSYTRAAYHSAQTLKKINSGLGMTLDEAMDFIYGELLPNYSAYYNRYSDTQKYKKEEFHQVILDSYEAIRHGGEGVLLELRHLALRNNISQQMNEQKRYTLLDNYSAVVKAVTSKKLDRVQTELNKSNDINEHFKDWTALHQAAQDGFLDAVKLLVENGADIKVRTRGNSPLMSAVKQNHIDVVQYLIDQGADVNVRSYSNLNSPLIEAAKRNHAEMVRLLLNNGADMWAESFDGDSAWEWATHKKYEDVVSIFKDFDGQDGYQAFQAIEDDNYNGFKRAIRSMSNLYQLNPEDDSLSLLSFAASKGQTQMIQLLIDEGMNINFSANNSTSAVYLAAKKNNLEALKLLAEHGADLNLQRDYAPMHTAAYRGHLDVLKYLVSQDTVDPMIKANYDSSLPLIQAVENNQTEAVKYLASLSVYRFSNSLDEDVYGNSPLIKLFKYKHDNRAMFNLLMQQPWTDISHRDKKDKAAYDYASEAGLNGYLDEL